MGMFFDESLAQDCYPAMDREIIYHRAALLRASEERKPSLYRVCCAANGTLVRITLLEDALLKKDARANQNESEDDEMDAVIEATKMMRWIEAITSNLGASRIAELKSSCIVLNALEMSLGPSGRFLYVEGKEDALIRRRKRKDKANRDRNTHSRHAVPSWLFNLDQTAAEGPPLMPSTNPPREPDQRQSTPSQAPSHKLSSSAAQQNTPTQGEVTTKGSDGPRNLLSSTVGASDPKESAQMTTTTATITATTVSKGTHA